MGGVSIKQHLESSLETAVAPPDRQETSATAHMPEQTAPSAAPGSTPARELNLALVLKTWNEHALALRNAGKSSIYATLMADKPTITGPHTLSFSIVNAVQENYMRSEKAALVGFLRRELGDDLLELQVVKEEAGDVRPRFTAKDRFLIMAEKNPALLKLREDLGLDVG